MTGARYGRDGDVEARLRWLEDMVVRQAEIIELLERERFPRWTADGSGDRVEGFMLNAQLDARAGCEGYGPTVSATVLDDDGELTTETIELGDIIMSPGDFLAAGSKGWMRLRNGEWKVLVPYCKTSGEQSPPPQITDPTPGDEYYPAFNRYSNFAQEVAQIMSSSSAFAGDMTNDGDELP